MIYSRYGYQPTGSVKAMIESGNDAMRLAGEDAASAMGHALDQNAHEAQLQAAEQRRRAYDSETARIGQDKKYGLLGGLLKQNSGFSGMRAY